MLSYIIGGLFTAVGIILAVVFHEPHFYTFFSIGLFVLFLEIYKSIVHKSLFSRWSFYKYVTFWVLLLIISILIDIIGMYLGYWEYPFYVTSWDEIIKYIFEWCIAQMYITLSFFIGLAILRRHHVSRVSSIILSLILFVLPIGLITEYFNHMAVSWLVLDMPVSNYSIGGYFIVFQTIGYWIMALIPWAIYKLVIGAGKIGRQG